jgi:hypothetical protein
LGYRPDFDVRYDVLDNLLTMVKDVNVMVLMKRILWPKQGEEVAIYQRGNLVIEGHVLYSGTDSVTILGTDAVTGSIDGKALSDGIDDGTITIKKKPRGWKGETR